MARITGFAPVLCAALLACGSVDNRDGTGGGSATGTSSTPSTSSTANTSSGPQGAGGCGGDGCTPLPGSQGVAERAFGGYLVTIASYPTSCGDSWLPECGPATSWNFRFELPDAALVAGTVLSLADADGWFVSRSPECSQSNQDYDAGSVTVASVGPQSVTLEVAGSGTPNAAGADGTYEVAVCPAPRSDGNTIAMRYFETPAGASSSNVSGTMVDQTDPNTLMIFLGNAPRSCTDPDLSNGACLTPRWDLVLRIPPEQQQVGTLQLDQVGALLEAAPDHGIAGSCALPGGALTGTVEFTSIDADNVTFTLAGTSAFASVPGNADGTYTAPRCF